MQNHLEWCLFREVKPVYFAFSAAHNGVNDYLNFQWAPRHPRDQKFPNIRGVLFPAGEVDVSLVLIPPQTGKTLKGQILLQQTRNI